MQVNDRTCLHAAASTGNVDVLNMLLQHSSFQLVGQMAWAALACHLLLCCCSILTVHQRAAYMI